MATPNGFYVNLMNDDNTMEDIGLFVLVDDQHSPIVDATTQNKKNKRTGNYTQQEDETLVRAWQCIGQDAVAGNEQKGSTYWKRIHEHYHASKECESDRNENSLQHRWATIQESVNRFAGCFEQIENIHQSGITYQQHIVQACALYKEKEKHHRPFQMLHCWTVLRNCEKWISSQPPTQPAKKMSKTSVAAPAPTPCANLGMADEEGHADPPTQQPAKKPRPSSRKAEKEKLKRGADGTVYKEVVQNLLAKKEQMESIKEEKREQRYGKLYELEQQKMAIEAQKLHIMTNQAETEKWKEEQKIIFMDTTGMDAEQLAWLKAMRAQIVAARQGNGSI